MTAGRIPNMLDVVPTKHRSLTLLAVVLLAQVLLLAVQIRSDGGVRLIRVWAVALVSPFQRAGAWMVDHIGGAWGSYVDLRNTREENRRLREELDALQLRNSQLESKAAEADRLAALLRFQEVNPESQMLPARVVGASAAGSADHVLFVNRGENDGVHRDMAVITPDGVVGKVLAVFPATSQVLLITDKESGVGALLDGSRTQGVVRGEGQPHVRMDYVVNEEPVHPGQRILTSGQDRIFPKDLPVGVVVSTTPGSPFQRILARPAARLDRLEEVLILLGGAPKAPGDALATDAAAEAPGVPR